MNLTTRFILTAALGTGLVVVAPGQNHDRQSRPGQNAPSEGRPGSERITNGPVLEGTGDTWAEVAWTTNTGGSTVVHYGPTPERLTQTAESPYSDNEHTASQNHRVRISNLQPGTTYYYRVDSGQGEGTGTDALSPVQQFTTKGAGGQDRRGHGEAERITNGPNVEGTGTTWAVVAWTTDTGGSSVVRYGTDPHNLGEVAETRYSESSSKSGANHRVRIENLRPNTTYYFAVDSGQGQGTGTDAKSNVQSFRTKG